MVSRQIILFYGKRGRYQDFKFAEESIFLKPALFIFISFLFHFSLPLSGCTYSNHGEFLPALPKAKAETTHKWISTTSSMYRLIQCRIVNLILAIWTSLTTWHKVKTFTSSQRTAEKTIICKVFFCKTEINFDVKLHKVDLIEDRWSCGIPTSLP